MKKYTEAELDILLIDDVDVVLTSSQFIDEDNLIEWFESQGEKRNE